VRLLWEACQVPDFRKLADDSHVALCAKLFTHLAREGKLPRDWVSASLAALERTDGDLDTLMARITAIRVWAYIAARSDWLDDAAALQADARRAEDMVSDALHEALTARFVDRRAAHLIRKMDEGEEELLSAVTRRGEVVVEGHPVGNVKGFSFEPDSTAVDEEERRVVLRAARRALGAEIPRRVAMLEAAKDEAFALTPGHKVTWAYSHAPNMPAGLGDIAEGAKLKPGPEPSKPQIEVLPSEFLDGAQRERIRERLATWIEALIKRELGAVFAAEGKAAEDNTLRGPAFRLREELGLAMGRTDPDIRPDLRQKLKGIGIRAGRYALFVPEAMKPKAMALRAQLWSLLRGIETPKLPGGGLIAVAPPEDWPRGFAETMGWLPAGPVLLRLDVAERIAGESATFTRRAPALLRETSPAASLQGREPRPGAGSHGLRLSRPDAEEGAFGTPAPRASRDTRAPARAHHGPGATSAARAASSPPAPPGTAPPPPRRHASRTGPAEAGPRPAQTNAATRPASGRAPPPRPARRPAPARHGGRGGPGERDASPPPALGARLLRPAARGQPLRRAGQPPEEGLTWPRTGATPSASTSGYGTRGYARGGRSARGWWKRARCASTASSPTSPMPRCAPATC